MIDVLAAEDEPRAVDTHAHQPTKEFLEDAGGQMMQDAAEKFGAEMEPATYEEMVAEYREAGVGRAVLLGWDAETNTGNPPVPNDYVAEVRDRHAEFFVGFGSVDPLERRLRAGGGPLRRGPRPLGVQVPADRPGVRPLRPPTRTPLEHHRGPRRPGRVPRRELHARRWIARGRGLKIEYGTPMLVDDVAADHPELEILLAHPAFPWEREQLAICQQKGNVYMDLSGWMPKYIDDQVLHYARTILQDKVMFGTDYPMVEPGPWLEQFAALEFDEDVQRKLLWENVEAFLGL